MSKIEMYKTVRWTSLKKLYTVLMDPKEGISHRQLWAALGHSNLRIMKGWYGWCGRIDGRPFAIHQADPGSVRRPKEWVFRVRPGNKWVVGRILRLAKRAGADRRWRCHV